MRDNLIRAWIRLTLNGDRRTLALTAILLNSATYWLVGAGITVAWNIALGHHLWYFQVWEGVALVLLVWLANALVRGDFDNWR